MSAKAKKHPAAAMKTKAPKGPKFFEVTPFFSKNRDGMNNFWTVDLPDDRTAGNALGEGHARLAFRNAHSSQIGAAHSTYKVLTEMLKARRLGNV